MTGRVRPRAIRAGHGTAIPSQRSGSRREDKRILVPLEDPLAATPVPATTKIDRDDRREVFGWMMYAWSFHGFVTTVATVMLGPYLTGRAQQEVGENGRLFASALLGSVTAKSFFFYCLSLSVFLQLFLLPLLGTLADQAGVKRRLLALTCALGSGATCLLFFPGSAIDFRWGGLLFVVANFSLGATSVVYNSFLPEIATPSRRDAVSSRSYALGYLGGGLLLGLDLAFMKLAPHLGVGDDLAVRLCLLSAGLWWAGFSLLTFRRLRARPGRRASSRQGSVMAQGLSELKGTWRELARLRHTRRFLVAYLLFGDGIQTVVAVASVFLSQELFVSRGLAVDQTFLLGLMLMVQFVGFLGALAFERVAGRMGAKRALVVALVIWCAVVVYGYGLLQTKAQAWLMAATIALVLGGSQALSRSLFSCMIPPGREAAFFGLYEVANSGTSWIGPLLFAVVVSSTNSYRQALLSLVVLFVAGSALLLATDTGRAIRDAGQWREPGPA